MPSRHSSPDKNTSANFRGVLLNEFANSPTPESAISNDRLIVSHTLPSVFSSPSSCLRQTPAVGSNYKTCAEYCPSPNVHPLKTQSEAQSPLSLFSPSFTQTSMFSSPDTTRSKQVKITPANASKMKASKRDQVLNSSPGTTKKKMRTSGTDGPQTTQFKNIVFATLPLSERLAPQTGREEFLSLPHPWSRFGATKDCRTGEQSPYNQSSWNESKPYEITSNKSSYNRVEETSTGVMLKQRINEVGAILRKSATAQESNLMKYSSIANPATSNKLMCNRDTKDIANKEIKSKPFYKTVNKINGTEENSSTSDRKDLTSIAVSLLKMASGNHST